MELSGHKIIPSNYSDYPTDIHSTKCEFDSTNKHEYELSGLIRSRFCEFYYIFTLDIHPLSLLCFKAYFEVITSEASYLKSLNILIDTFLMSKFLSPDSGNVTRLERHHIFSNIVSVMETSER